MTFLGTGLFGQAEPPTELQSEFDPAVDFTSAKLFYVLDISEDQPGVDPEIVRRVAPACEDATRSMLKAKGYSEVLSLYAADIAAYVHGSSIPKSGEVLTTKQKKTSNPNWLRGRRHSAYAKSTVALDDYDRASLIVEVYNVESGNLIWMGSLSRESNPDPEDRPERAAMAVFDILADYPDIGKQPTMPRITKPGPKSQK